MLKGLRNKFGKKATVKSRRKMQFEALEPRILLSADLGIDPGNLPGAKFAPAAIEQPLVHETNPRDHFLTSNPVLSISNPQQATNRFELILIDATLPDTRTLIDNIKNTGAADGSVTYAIHQIHPDEDGFSQISDILKENGEVDAIHILSHGSQGRMNLGSTSLGLDNLDQYRESFSSWSASLTEDADILLYGCNIASGDSGFDFVTSLANLTRADVSASANATGAEIYSGDWALEVSSGNVETKALNLSDYPHLLFTLSGTNGNDTLILDDDGSSNDGLMRYSFDGNTWTSFSLGGDDLAIQLGAGNDTIEIRGFDTSFTQGVRLLGGAGSDTITVNENVSIRASQILFEAESIAIHQGAFLDATINGSGDGSLVLKAEADGSGLPGSLLSDVARAAFGDDGVGEAIAAYVDGAGLPFDYLHARTNIAIDGATLTGKSISASATSTIGEQDLDLPFSLKALVAIAGAAVTVTDSTLTATGGGVTLSSSSSITVNNTAKSLGTPLADAAGSVTVVVSEARTTVSGSSTLEADGDIQVLSDNTTVLKTLADGTVGGMTQAGGVVAVTVAVTDTLASLEGAIQVVGSGTLNVKASSSNTLTTTAVSTPGGADGKGGLIGSLLGTNSMKTGDGTGDTNATSPLSLAGALAISVLTQNTDAHIQADNGTINSTAVTVATESAGSVTTKADASSTNTPSATVGGGIAAAGNIIITTNDAFISGSATFTGATSITVNAGMADGTTHTSSVTAVSGASSGSFGGTGAFGLNVSTNSTAAFLGSDSTLNMGAADLSLDAVNRTSNTVLATGTQAGTGGFGAGGSLALNIGVNNTLAEILGTTALTGINALGLTALGEHTQSTTSEAGAGGDVALSPAIALAVAVNETSALLPRGNTLLLAGGLVLTATHSSSQTTRAKADAAGKSAGFGVGLALTVDVENAMAQLDRNVTSNSGNASITASSKVDANTTATASSAGEKAPDSTGGDASGKTTADSQMTEGLNMATGRGEVKDKTKDLPPPEAKTGDGDLSVAGALAVNVATSQSTAEITEGTALVTEGTLTLSAANDTDASATADASAVGTGNTRLAPTQIQDNTDSTITSGLSLTFADNAKADARDTLTRSSGSWLADGFKAGDTLTLSGDSGTNSLNGTYTIAGVTETFLTFTESTSLANKTIDNASELTLKKTSSGTETILAYSGALTAKDNAANQYDSLTRSTGTWSYQAGDVLTITGTGRNNKTVTVESVSQEGRTLTFTPSAELAGETLSTGTVTLAKGGENTVLTCSGVGVAFKHNAASPDTIVLSGTTWTAKGYSAGDTLIISGSAHNNGKYTIGSISTDGTILTLKEGVALTEEPAGSGIRVDRLAPGQLNGPAQLTFTDAGDNGDTITRSSGSWVEDGFAIGDAITISGSNANDNTYVIKDILNNGSLDNAMLVLADGYFLSNEANTSGIRATLLTRGETATYSGTAAQLTLTHHADRADWITRDSGSWIKDGFAVGDSIAVTAGGKVTTFTITEVFELSITLSDEANLSLLTPSEITSIQRATSEEAPATPGIGIGVAGAINVATILNRATLAGDVTARGITLEALMDSRDTGDTQHTLGAKAVSGAGAGNVGVAGSLAVDIGVTESQALVTGTAVLSANNETVSLKAENKTSTTTQATAKESATGTGGFGAGASVALNVGVNTARAEIHGNAELTDAGALSLTSSGDHVAVTTAEAGAGGATALGGAVALNVGINTTTAILPLGSGLSLGGGLTLQADHKGSAVTTAKADVAGSESGFAVGFALNARVDQSEAILDRNVTSSSGDIIIHAHTVSDTSASSTAGVNGADKEKAEGSGESDAKAQVDKQFGFATGQKTLDGKEKPKLDEDTTQTSDGGVSVGAALAVNVAVSESVAEITQGTLLVSDGSLTLSAANDTDATATADASAVGKGKAATAAAASALPATTVTGDSGLSFAANGTNADTLTRSRGSWSSDGYKAGDVIVVTGAAKPANNGTFTITGISLDGRVLILADATFADGIEEANGSGVIITPRILGKLNGDATLTFFDAPGANADTISRSNGSWLADGFTTGDAITITGSGTNDNTYVVAKATDTVLFLDSGYFLEGASSVSKVEVTLLKRNDSATYKGNTSDLAYVHQADGADQIHRNDTGSWIADGFAVGDRIVITATDDTFKTFFVTAISETSLTLGKDDDVSTLTSSSTKSVARDTQAATTAGTPGIGIGVAVAVNSATVTNQAILAGHAFSKGVTLEAVMDSRDSQDNQHTLAAKAASGASAGDVGVAGAFAVNVGVLTSQALITETGQLDAGEVANPGDVSLTAENKSSTTVVASGLQKSLDKTGEDPGSSSDSVGVGGSFAMNVGVNTAKAQIAGAAALSHAKDLSLTATGEHAATVTSEAGAGGDIGVAGAVALSVGINTTTAVLPKGTDLTLDGGLTLKADHKGSAVTTANADAAGEKVGVGVALALTVEVDQAIASLDRNLTSASGDTLIHAHALSDSSTTSTASSKGARAASDDGTGGEKEKTADEQVSKQKDFLGQRTGNTGTPLPETENPPAGNSDGDSVNIGAALAANIAISESIAEITDGTLLVVEDGAITLSAANDTDASAKADASASARSSADAAETGAVVTGGLTLIFADNASNTASSNDTITRSSGSWATNGFAVGDKITVAGTNNNSSTGTPSYTISALSADGLTLTLAAGDTLSNETASGSKLKVAKLATPPETTPAQVFGGPDITFSDNGANHNDTITLSSGSWAEAGFSAGDTINVLGTGNTGLDKKAFTIKSISLDGRVLVLADGDELVSLSKASGSSLKIMAVKPGSLSGYPELTFTDNGSEGAQDFTGDTLVRSAGSWIEDGFAVGATIKITGAVSADGATSNDGKYTIAGISEDGKTLTLAPDETLATLTLTDTTSVGVTRVNRGEGGALTLVEGQFINFVHNDAAADQMTRSATGSWLQDGFAVGDTLEVSGSESNNGTYTVAAISGDGKTITLKDGDTLTTENIAKGADLKVTVQGSSSNSGSKSVGIGVAVGINTAVVTNQARVLGDIDQTPDNTVGNDRAKGLTLEAMMDTRDTDGKHTLASTAISGGSGGDAGIAGAFALNVSVLASEAYLQEGSTINLGHANNQGDLLIRAENKSSATVLSTAKGVAASGGGSSEDQKTSVGVGGSLAVNVAVNTARAEVEKDVLLTGTGGVELKSTGDHSISTTSEAGSGGDVSISPSIATSIAVNQTTAILAQGNDLAMDGNLTLSADHSGDTKTTVTADAAGGKAAVGVSLAATVAIDRAEAGLYRNADLASGNVKIEAKNLSSSSSSAKAGASGGAPGSSGQPAKSADEKISGETNGAANYSAKAKTEVDKNQENKDTAKAENSDGSVSVGAALAANVAVSESTARIAEGVTLTANTGSVSLTAANDTDGKAAADGSATSSDYGVGAAVAVNTAIVVNQAMIEGNVHADQGVSARAVMHDGDTDSAKVHTTSATAVSGAGAKKVGVSGSGAVNVTVITSQAMVSGNSTVDAGGGQVLLETENTTNSNVSASSKATVSSSGSEKDGSSVGVGASFASNVAVNTSWAEIEDGAVLLNTGDLDVKAGADHTLGAKVVAGSAGDIAVSPAVALNVGVNTTLARIGTTGQVQAVSTSGTGNVTLQAKHKANYTTTGDAEAAGDKVAVGATVAAGIGVDTVSAGLYRDLDTSGATEGHVTLLAKSEVENKVEVKAGAKGANKDSKNSDGEADKQVNDNKNVTRGTGGKLELPSASEQVNKADETSKDKTEETGQKSGTNSVGVAAAVGVGVSVATTTAEIGNGLTVQAAGTVKISAENETDGMVKALGTAISKKIDTSVAAAVSINSVVSTTVASIGDQVTLTADGISVTAGTPKDTSSDLIAWGMAGAGGKDYGIAGSVAANVGVFTTRAGIGENAVITSSGENGSIGLSALNDVGVQSLAGGFGIGGKAGVGVAAGINVVVETTTSTIGANTQVDADKAFNVTAESVVGPSTELEIFGKDLDLTLVEGLLPMAIVAGGGISKGSDDEEGDSTEVSVGGALAVNSLVLTTTATLGDGVRVNQNTPGNSDQTLHLLAQNTTRITGGAFGLAGGGEYSFGIGVGVNVVVENTLASMGSGALVQAGGNITVEALSDDELVFLVGSFALSTDSDSGAGISGSLAVYSLTNTTRALIDDSTEVTSAGDIAITAVNTSDLYQLTGSLAGSAGDAGVGVSVGILVHVGVLQASVGTGTIVESRNLSLTASSDDTVLNLALGGAAATSSEGTAAGAAITVTTLVNVVDARILEGAVINTGEDVSLSASSQSQLDVVSFGGAASGDKAGGGAAAVNVVTNTVHALIEKATVHADGMVSLSASSSPIIRGISVGASGAGKVAVSVAAMGNVIVDTVTAEITGSTIQAGNDVRLSAKDLAPLVLPAWALNDDQKAKVNEALEDSPIALDANILALNISVAGSGETAVSGALMGNIVTNTITSAISGSDVRAGVDETGTVFNDQADILVDSKSDSGIIALSVGVAGSGKTGVQASGFGNVITNRTAALVNGDSAILSGDRISLGARDMSQIRSLALSVAASGSTAVSVLIGANVIVNDVEAVISGSTVVNHGALELSAENNSDILAFSGGVAASGSTAVMTSLSANVVTNRTSARMEDSVVTADGAISLEAKDSSTIDALSFGVSASGSNAVGVAASANVIANDITAAISGSQITGGSTLDLDAGSSAGIHTLAVGVAGSGSVAVSVSAMGNVVTNRTRSIIEDSVITLDDGLHLKAKDDNPSLIPSWLVPEQYTSDFNAALEGSPIDLDGNILALNISVAASGSTAVNAAFTGNVITNTVLTNITGSEVTTGQGDILLDSETHSGILALTVGVAGSGSVAVNATGFGNVITNTTNALIENNSNVEAENGSVGLNADDGSQIRSAGISVAGSGAVAVGALIGANVIANTVTAEIAGSTVSSHSTLDLSAFNDADILGLTVGVAASGTGAGLLSLSANVITNTTRAAISGQNDIRSDIYAGGAVEVSAKDSSEINTLAIGVAGSGGGAVGASIAANVITNTIETEISNTDLMTDATLDLDSESSAIIRTLAIGVSASGGFAVQLTVMGNLVSNDTSALISGSTVTAAHDITLSAQDVAPGAIPFMDAIGEYVMDEQTRDDLADALAGSPVDPTANILSLMVSVAGTGGVAVNGAFTGNMIENDIQA
ncbi:MAG: DUF4347 domain-containing protein, partial [Proteobacteria bacterium]|nr:DUF4347 domain-containing protein [Pseudomonadota bacterium]MBU4469864.1 DUF4347 domain-containing protein [Pseudomonadota bacterium]MCG2753099.1 DUF4347 domain-containing protein [Desulfobacteraceae bacterium]